MPSRDLAKASLANVTDLRVRAHAAAQLAGFRAGYIVIEHGEPGQSMRFKGYVTHCKRTAEWVAKAVNQAGGGVDQHGGRFETYVQDWGVDYYNRYFIHTYNYHRDCRGLGCEACTFPSQKVG